MTDNHGQRNGHCAGCQWWQTDTAGHADGTAAHGLGLCLHEEIAHFQLQVSGESGCNRFEADLAGHPWEMAVEMGAGD
jgi:hypothetical protein